MFVFCKGQLILALYMNASLGKVVNIILYCYIITMYIKLLNDALVYVLQILKTKQKEICTVK